MANVKISDITTTETDPANIAYFEAERTSGNTPVKVTPALLGVKNPLIRLGSMRPLTDFTQENISGTKSVVETSGKAITIKESNFASGSKVFGIRRAVPAAPYLVAAFIQPNPVPRAYNGPVFGWSDGTKLHVLADVNVNSTRDVGQVEVHKYNSATSRSSSTGLARSVGAARSGTGYWVGMWDDNSGKVFFCLSSDGVNFTPVHVATKSSDWLGSSGYTNVFVGLFSEAHPSGPSGTDYPHSISIREWDESGLSRTF